MKWQQKGRGEGAEWKDQLPTELGGDNELSQTYRCVRRVREGVMPRVQSKLSRAIHAHHGKNLNEESSSQVQESVERGAMTFVECLGVSHEDTMEASLWRESFGRSLRSHDVAKLVGGMCRGNCCRQEITHLHATSCTKTRWSSLPRNRVLHQALARSLRESKVQFVVEDTRPSREEASGQNGGIQLFTILMDIATEVKGLFDSHSRCKNKALLLDITIVNPCGSSNLENAVGHAEKHLADAVERKKNKNRGSSLPRHLLPPSSRIEVW